MAENFARPVRRHRSRELIPPGVLAHVPGCEAGQPPESIERVYKSRRTMSYRVVTAEGEFAVRLRLAGAPGADHEREALLHGIAAPLGLAPTLFHADPAGRFMVTEYVAGGTWRPEDFGNVARIRQLGAWLRELHALEAPQGAAFDFLATLQGYSTRILRSRPAEAPLHSQLLSRAESAARKCASEERPPTIIHNDLHHTNIFGGERIRAIDWEYAAVCDPIFDLACVIAYYPRAWLHAGDLLSESGLRGVTKEMLEEAAWLAMLTSYFWHRLLRLSSSGGDERAEHDLLRRLQS